MKQHPRQIKQQGIAKQSLSNLKNHKERNIVQRREEKSKSITEEHNLKKK